MWSLVNTSFNPLYHCIASSFLMALLRYNLHLVKFTCFNCISAFLLHKWKNWCPKTLSSPQVLWCRPSSVKGQMINTCEVFPSSCMARLLCLLSLLLLQRDLPDSSTEAACQLSRLSSSKHLTLSAALWFICSFTGFASVFHTRA